METTILTTLLIITSSIFTFFTLQSHSANPCQPTSCHDNHGPIIRFPFRLKNRQPARCGYPGFDLSCNTHNQTILNLPKSGKFIVDYIDYTTQSVLITDPNSCLPNRILNFTLSGSPFLNNNLRSYTFFNCSSNWTDYSFSHFVPFFCASRRNYTVLAVKSGSVTNRVPNTCRRIGNVSVPMQWAVSMYYWSEMDMKEDLELVWTQPDCQGCENRGGFCGYVDDSGLEIGCFGLSRSRGLPRSAKSVIIVCVGIPGLLCTIGLISYTWGMIRATRLQRRINSNLPTTTFSDQRLAIRSPSGLDRPTIESFPKIMLGESRRLPKSSDIVCPICLGDYLPKETLRSIPECNHYFHVGCIDEWLKLNGTCPLCRRSTESSTGTYFSSIQLPSSSSTTFEDR